MTQPNASTSIFQDVDGDDTYANPRVGFVVGGVTRTPADLGLALAAVTTSTPYC